MLKIELAFFGHAFKRFAGIFYAVLIVVAIGRQQLDDLVRAACARTADRARRVEHRLADTELVRAQHWAARADLMRNGKGGHSRKLHTIGRFRLARNLP